MRRLVPSLALAALASIVALTVHDLTTERTPPAASAGESDAEAVAGDGHARAPAGEPAGPGGTAASGRSAADGAGGGSGPRRLPGRGQPEDGGAGAGPDAEAGPATSFDRRRYAVAGTTGRQLRRSLRENGRRMEGEVAFAWTDWSVDVGYEFRRSGDSCRVTRPDVDVSISVTLPEWRDRDDAPADLADRWRRDLALMEEHEEGHVRLARRAGRRVYEAIDALEAAPCGLLRDRADAAAERVLSDVRRAQEAYDERTDHGRRQEAAHPGDRR